jgi:hypothetical protein
VHFSNGILLTVDLCKSNFLLTDPKQEGGGILIRFIFPIKFIEIAIFGFIVFTLTACAPTQVDTISEYYGSLPRPDQILVYEFAVSPDEIQLDRGISARIEDLVNKTPRTDEERAVGRAVANALASHLVEEIQALGLPSQRARGVAPAKGNVLEIEGQFISIDEGNRTERVVIGLGAGRTDVRTYVQVFDARGGRRVIASEFETDARSGYKPGVAETMGVGAAAGHLGTSAAIGSAFAAGSETFAANVEADATRTAKAIAKQLRQFFVDQGWIPPSALE